MSCSKIFLAALQRACSPYPPPKVKRKRGHSFPSPPFQGRVWLHVGQLICFRTRPDLLFNSSPPQFNVLPNKYLYVCSPIKNFLVQCFCVPCICITSAHFLHSTVHCFTLNLLNIVKYIACDSCKKLVMALTCYLTLFCQDLYTSFLSQFFNKIFPATRVLLLFIHYFFIYYF